MAQAAEHLLGLPYEVPAQQSHTLLVRALGWHRRVLRPPGVAGIPRRLH
jgi:hypothetical protein